MSADIIQFVPRPNPSREANLERQAIEIMNIALMGEPGMVGMEPVIYLEMDTAPSEMNPYTAPDKDSA